MLEGQTDHDTQRTRDEPEQAGELTQTRIYELLQNERRQITLRVLDRQEGQLSLRSLSEAVAVAESGEDPPPDNRRRSVYVSLQQTHLPTLADCGVVAYDDHQNVVSLTEEADAVLAYLNQSTDSNPVAGLLPVGTALAVCGVAGTVAVWAATGFLLVPVVGWLFGAVVAFVVVALVWSIELP